MMKILNQIRQHIFLVIVSILVIIPVIWVFVNSVKPSSEILLAPLSFPSKIDFGNYVSAWSDAGLGVGFVNSLIVTSISIILIVFLSAMVAFVLSKKQFRFKKTIQLSFLLGLMLPTFLAMAPLFLLMNKLDLVNSLVGLVLVYVAYSLSFTIFILIAFFNQVPDSLEEAAVIDGCGPFRVFWNVMLPLVKPGLISAAIFNFVGIWNEYILALILISDDSMKTLPLQLANIMMIQQYHTDWGALYAGLVLSIIPVTIFFLIFQRRLIEGSTAGSIKG
ncbi:carbohydrate ABC transporter permease [Aquisalibacillus elongatus]|uniref:Raffinose/stachyose/melibiose transport system permease protein/N-acetylglucosamine transport system permease protein n=1 Tax=Aquisalibacillus elongatus TaxID=485577 RepID=A0A3N5CBN5_9BACI|nr:carbohydrate ABC transporter permease [Aquisalibacillus elongatus]RPF54271.1 raffinose/stachyose/melibiose transport system permease protein/N-acetylglucosamine transport system permease protein [Aquisalibacillus elongatus]